jgi:hypothetical protein
LRDLLKIKESNFFKIAQQIKILKIQSSELKGQIDLLNQIIQENKGQNIKTKK